MTDRSSLKTGNAALTETQTAQSTASDPAVSAWVSANAGAGKTHVLKMRVLRLLLAGTAPERLLCLTYTKAAAAEMSARVFADLADWATGPDEDLDAALTALLQRAPSDMEKGAARRLFARAIETPGGLKVQTIHAFCERLLQRFPLEACVPARFTVLDEETGRALQRDAVTSVLETAVRDPASDLGRALATAVAFAADERFDHVLAEALAERGVLAAVCRLARESPEAFADLEQTYRRAFGIRACGTPKAVEEEMTAVLDNGQACTIRDVLSAGSEMDQEAAEKLAQVFAATRPAARLKALTSLFMTAQGEPRKRLVTKKTLAKLKQDSGDLLNRAQDKFVALDRERQALVLIDATLALLRLAEAVMQRYQEAKRGRAALDFEDLIAQASGLLSSVDAAQWVLYKLDGGLDHILVDEAQDTSPVQWSIIESLAAEFLSGAGARDAARTLFAVGDEKQSIYSFQRAAPKMFADAGTRFAKLARAVTQPWKQVPLNLSFRSVPVILAGVDDVFTDVQRTPGVSAGAGSVRHVALRTGQAGMIELWAPEVPSDAEPAEPWSPLEERTALPPAVRLAERIATTIAGWLESGERLTSEDRPIRPGDILILVRRRRPFAGPMVAALKARGIAVAGADRMYITDQLAVQDLMALGDFLLLPEDDLALATVLKSPLFEHDDDDLLAIAPGRKGALWRALLEAAQSGERFAATAKTLKQWRARADALPPFEFYAGVLDARDANGDTVRARLLARLGPDAADPIDELLSQALAYDDGAPTSLQGFLASLRQGRLEIKRDMEHGRNEVRVMTVHGAKGLEAPIVFLPDSIWSTGLSPRTALLKLAAEGWPAHLAEPLAWAVKGSGRLKGIEQAKDAKGRAEAEERDRLLYVAMTRARDRLYIAGFSGKRASNDSCWYELIRSALQDRLFEVELPDGRPAWRMQARQTMPHEVPRGEAARAAAAEPLPEWAHRPAPREPRLVIPLAPSRLAALAVDEEGEPRDPDHSADPSIEPPPPSPPVLAEDQRLLRGALTHALLEHLPRLAPNLWERAAAAFLAKRAAALPTGARDSIAAETLAILRDPAFAPVFGPQSRAEVAMVARIANPQGKGPDLQISGRIDRLAQVDGEMLIVDYKTNRPAPAAVEDVAPASLYQLAAYRLALQHVFGAMPVRAALVWTHGARLMHIPSVLLDDYQRRIWELERPVA